VISGTKVEPEASITATRPDFCSVPAAEGYERWAPIYDQSPNPLLNREERYLLPLLLNMHKQRILDLACGTGRWLERLSSQGIEPGVGIDCSAAMLRVARRKEAITGRVARGICGSLPFRTAAFDLAICSFAAGHIQDLDSMVNELARVTKPSADVFVSDLHAGAYDRGWRVGFRDANTAVQIETLPRTAEDIVQKFCSSGFECVTQVPLYLGDPEKPIFAQAGKSHLFAEVCRLPAILVGHFLRSSSPSED
jgi:ubiquinone/menaquinone biosynthesis C-methylase UbiE